MLKEIEEKAVIERYPQPSLKKPFTKNSEKCCTILYFQANWEIISTKRFNEVQDENCGLRISMRFSEDVPEIAALPWEYLHNEEDFLITRRSILLSRLPPRSKENRISNPLIPFSECW